MKGRTFDLESDEEKIVEVEIQIVNRSSGLCAVKFPDGRLRVRHRDRIEPIDDAAREALNKPR